MQIPFTSVYAKSMQMFFAKIVQSELGTFESDNHNPNQMISITTMGTLKKKDANVFGNLVL